MIKLNLKTKFLFGTIGLITLLGLAMLFFVQTIVSKKLLSELQDRGIIITKNLAEESINPVLAGRTEDLQLFINEYRSAEKDINYIFVLDSRNHVYVHTFEKNFPSEIKNANVLKQGKKHSIEALIVGDKPVLDIAVPILGGEAGVIHVGISEEPIRKTVADFIRLILAMVITGLVLGGIGVILLSTIVTKPIVELMRVAKLVGSGNLDSRVNISTTDEVGQLGLTFNKMIEDLGNSRNEIIQSREYIRDIIQSMNEALIVVSSDGYIRTVNEATCELLGYKENELITQEVEKIFAEEDFMATRSGLDDLIKEKYVKNMEEVFLSKNKQKIPVIFSSSVMYDDNDNIEGVIFVAQALTERKRLEEKLQNALMTLRRAMKGAIQAMALTVERRDPFTAGHQQRVADLARAISKEMGFTDDRIDGIRLCAVVHDLGKIFIPAGILNKAGKLTQEEYGIIKKHPQDGYEILKEIDFPWPIATMELQHHERINGSGYPNGLKGEETLMEAKIIAVSDVVEAMVYHRSYHETRDISVALDEISKNKGILYEPEVVDVCLKLFKEKGFVFK